MTKDLVVKCSDCGMVHTSHAPTEEELQAYYANYPVVSTLSPITRTRYLELLDRFEAFRKNNRIIDVGCGSGLFLQVAAERGWEVHGTEYGSIAIDACRSKGIDIIEGALDPKNYPPGHFDVVCSFEVLEHLIDPAGEVARMGTILRDGGLLYATTPNFNCLARRAAPSDWSVANYPEHLSYFTPRTLRRLFGDIGMRPLWLGTSGFSVARWLSGRRTGAVRANAQARQEQLRADMEYKPHMKLAKRVLNFLLHSFSLGDSLKGAFIRSTQRG
ncbi:MAG: class I SAM-dependent methyltransferase [Flavobacteriales bacterium]